MIQRMKANKSGLQGLVIAIVGVSLSIIMLLSAVDPHRAWVLVFASIYLFVCCLFWVAYRNGGAVDLLSPFPVFLLVLFLYAASSGMFVDTSGVTYTGDEISHQTRVTFYVACLLGAVGFALGSLVGKKYSFFGVHGNSGPWSHDESAFIRTCVVIGVVFASMSASDVISRFNFVEVASYQEWALSSRIDRQADTGAGIRDVMFYYLPINLIIAGCVAIVMGSGNILLRVVAASVVFAYLVTNTLAGARGVVVEAAIPLVVYWHYRVRRFRAVEIGAGVVLGYVFINLLSIARVSSDPIRMMELVIDAARDSGAQIVSLGAVSELWTATNLHRLIQGIGAGETGFTYGRSLIDEFLTFAPRAIFPDRPMSLSERFVDTFYPGLLESGGGMGLFILQEGYWSFGIVGVFLSMSVYGYSLERVYRTYLRYQASVAATLVYGFAYGPLVLSSVRSGMIGSYKSALLMVFPLVLALLVTRIFRRHQNLGGNAQVPSCDE